MMEKSYFFPRLKFKWQCLEKTKQQMVAPKPFKKKNKETK